MIWGKYCTLAMFFLNLVFVFLSCICTCTCICVQFVERLSCWIVWLARLESSDQLAIQDNQSEKDSVNALEIFSMFHWDWKLSFMILSWFKCSVWELSIVYLPDDDVPQKIKKVCLENFEGEGEVLHGPRQMCLLSEKEVAFDLIAKLFLLHWLLHSSSLSNWVVNK